MWEYAHGHFGGGLWCFARPCSVIQENNHEAIIDRRNSLRNATGYPHRVAETHAPEDISSMHIEEIDMFWSDTSITRTETLSLLAVMKSIRGALAGCRDIV